MSGRHVDDPSPELDEDDAPPSRARRFFLGSAVAACVAGVSSALGSASSVRPGVRLRPPGALPEESFLDACTRCFRCGSACPNGCIEFEGFGAGIGEAFTPVIHARSRGCVLCGECADACPTGALRPFEVTREGWQVSVNMGKARVNREMCFSYNGRTCGACYRACPLAGEAMTIGLMETPIVHIEHCVGCGLCEQACLHLPQAIRVIPTVRHHPDEAQS